MFKSSPAGLALAMTLPWGAIAAPSAEPAEIAALRQEIAAIRAAYEGRLQALEQRLRAAESAGPAVPQAPASPSAAAAPVLPPPAPLAQPVPPPPAQSAGANAFNPAISLILSGLYARSSQDPARYAMTGFQLPTAAELGPAARGLSLAETELALSANIDPWWRGVATVSLHADNGVSVEQAFVQTTALGQGLRLKAGRFFSGLGYLNAQHAHTWDVVDNPLAYQAFLGTQYGDDGLQLTWLAPTDQFVELGVELGRGRGFPGSGGGGNGAGMAALTAHTGGDVGASHSWRAGLSVLGAKAEGLGLTGVGAGGGAVTSAFSGNTRVWIADAVWKWAPDGNAARTNFKLQGEFLQSRRSGSLVYDVGGADSAGAYRSLQSGWYLQGVWQFMPRWRVALRGERLDAGHANLGANAGGFAGDGYRPRKHTLMLDHSASEFSRVRLQFAQDRSRQGALDNQLSLQYLMSLGAHGAHGY